MVEIDVCIGSACHIQGSYNVIQVFQQIIEERKLHDAVALKATFCMRRCEEPGVSVSVDGQKHRVRPEEARGFFDTVVKG